MGSVKLAESVVASETEDVNEVVMLVRFPVNCHTMEPSDPQLNICIQNGIFALFKLEKISVSLCSWPVCTAQTKTILGCLIHGFYVEDSIAFLMALIWFYTSIFWIVKYSVHIHGLALTMF